MGATTFLTEATGTTPGDAFSSALKDALYWNGHGGYTGTIAEKPGYIMFDVPTNLPEPAYPHDGWGDNDFISRFINAMSEAYYESPVDGEEHNWQKQARDDISFFRARMGASFDSMLHLYNSKWDAAVCFPAGTTNDGKTTYIFCGLASC